MMAGGQAVGGDTRRQMVHMMVGDIGGEPVEPARQIKKAGALECCVVVTPAFVASRIGMFEVVLHRKDQNAAGATD